jgi:hypothetical protein
MPRSPLPFVPRRTLLLAGAALCTAVAWAACSNGPAKSGGNISHRPAAATQPYKESDPLVRLCRRQSSYVRLDIREVVPGMEIEVGEATGPAPLPLEAITAFSARILRGTVTGPQVDQLTGSPGIQADTGSYLIPAPSTLLGETRRFTLDEPMPVYLKVEAPPAQEPGKYDFPITIRGPKKGSVTSSVLRVEVADIALPTEPRVLAVATTNTTDLTRIFPETFGPINPIYLDRDDPVNGPAIQQVDVLVKAAQKEGVALFIEDVGPRVRVDDVGRVSIDWEGYDRLMQPYMDGTAFDDRVPLQVWLAPVPPRRIRDTPTQLRQYMAACVEHFSEKGWIATPVFLHPALVEPAGDEARDKELQAAIEQTMQLHLSRDMLAVTTPDAAVSHARLWVVDDTDPRLPPAGKLATEQSEREWPWMCAGRGIRGFVWRNAVAGATDLRQGAGTWNDSRRPLLVALNTPVPPPKTKDKKAPPPPPPTYAVLPTLRMAAVSQGLGDTTLLGLLEKRSDSAISSEVLGGLVGRTGITTIVPPGGVLPTATPGFLYAGWPSDRDTWNDLPGMLQRLVLANDPGHRVTVSPDDPLYLATKLWLAQAHRPVVRVSGYRFDVRSSLDGPVLEMGIELHTENPVGAPVETVTELESLPGDLNFNQVNTGTIPAHGLRRVALPAAGHLDSLINLQPAIVSVTEKTAGAVLRLPINLPIHRAAPLEAPPKVDGRGDDWLAGRPNTVFGPMAVGTRYLTRPQFLTGAVRHEASPATVQWAYDGENLYLLARCPQETVTDERNTDWPAQGAAGAARWWGTDGLQVQLAPIPVGNGTPGQILDVAFKPGGVLLVRTGKVAGDGTPVRWSDAQPVTGIKYGIVIDKSDGRTRGYTVEAAIPRRWIDDPQRPANAPVAWRVNVLRHRASDLVSTSWAGPLVGDDDVAMMGILIGRP